MNVSAGTNSKSLILITKHGISGFVQEAKKTLLVSTKTENSSSESKETTLNNQNSKSGTVVVNNFMNIKAMLLTSELKTERLFS